MKFFVRGCSFRWWPPIKLCTWCLCACSNIACSTAELNKLTQALIAVQNVQKVVPNVQRTPPKRILTPEEEADEIARDLGALDTSMGVALETSIRVREGATLKIALPLLGTVTLRAEKDARGATIFVADFPPREKPLKFGELSIETGQIRLAHGHVSYTSRITLFGKSARMGLKELSINPKTTAEGDEIEVYKIVFGVAFDKDAVALAIAPGKGVELRKIDLVFEQQKGVALRAHADIFGQDAFLGAEYDSSTKSFAIKGEITKRKLTDVLPELAGSALDALSIEGTLNFTVSDGLSVKGVLSGDKNSAVQLEGIAFNKALLEFSSKKQQAFIMADSDVLGLPIKGYCAIALSKQPRIQFKLHVPLTQEWQPFKDFPNDELREIKIGSLHIVSEGGYNALVDGIDMPLSATKPKKNSDQEEPMTFNNVMQHGTAVRKGAQFLLYLAGDATILGVKSEVIAKVFATQSSFGATLVADLPKGWKIGDSIKSFAPNQALKCKDFGHCLNICSSNPTKCAELGANYIKSALELVQLDHARFVVSTREDSINEQRIEKGFNLLAGVSIGGSSGNIIIDALHEILVKTGNENAHLHLVGGFNPAAPRSISFKMGITSGGFGFKIGPGMLYGANLNVVVRGEPSIGIEGLCKFKPTEKDEPIELAINAAFTPIKFEMSGSALNTWKNPLGLKHLEFGNLALRGSQTYTAIEEAIAAAAGTAGVGALWILVPADLGFAGCIRFGKPDGKNLMVNTQMNVGKDLSSLALVGDICEPTALPYFLDVIAEQVGLDISIASLINTVMPIQLKKAGLRFVPIGTSIGNIKIEQGFGGYFYMDLFGKEAHLDLAAGLSGITAKGTIPAFEIGPLKMTNYDNSCPTLTPLGLLQQGESVHNRPPVCWCNEKDRDRFIAEQDEPPHTCGPQIALEITAREQRFVIDGLMKIGEIIQSKTKWFLTKDGFGFDTETFIGPEKNKLGVRIKGTSLSFEILDLMKIKPEDILLEIEFKDELSERLRADIAKELERVQVDFERDVNMALEQIGRDTMIEDIRMQEKEVKGARNNRVWFLENPPLSVKRELEVTKQELKLLALQTKYYFEKTEIGKFLSDTARKVGFDKLAQGVLGGFKEVGVGLLKHGRLAFDDISKLVIVKRIYWKGTLADLAKTKLPGIEVTMCAGCEEFTRILPGFDLLNPFNSTGAIARELFGTIKQVVIATFRGGTCRAGTCGKKQVTQGVVAGNQELVPTKIPDTIPEFL